MPRGILRDQVARRPEKESQPGTGCERSAITAGISSRCSEEEAGKDLRRGEDTSNVGAGKRGKKAPVQLPYLNPSREQSDEGFGTIPSCFARREAPSGSSWSTYRDLTDKNS
ncbi:hypothetical protein Bbelb_313820 [Branchiostoma belcheri]|nr:hypothetical protein Bbelb_313820 [Branchiostoma belcheri]